MKMDLIIIEGNGLNRKIAIIKRNISK